MIFAIKSRSINLSNIRVHAIHFKLIQNIMLQWNSKLNEVVHNKIRWKLNFFLFFVTKMKNQNFDLKDKTKKYKFILAMTIF